MKKAADYILSRLPQKPEIGVILGSGLGGLAEQIEEPIYIPYSEIPGFSAATAPGHKGRFVAGKLGGRQVLCMQGRLHFYEGHSMSAVIFPMCVMGLTGIRTVIVTNAAGGINLDFSVGDIMLIEDHINFFGTNPLIGENDKKLGTRFPDMSTAYSPRLRKIAISCADELGMVLQHGVYLGCSGPSFETPAEIRAFRALGADAVGMSTVPEVIAAVHCGMQVLAFSLITNMAAGVLPQPLNEQEVIEIGSAKSRELTELVKRIIQKLS